MGLFGRRRSLKENGIFKDFTDCHSHILPGVDDGVRTMEEALEILAAYEQLEVAEVWLTPHIMEDIPNTPADLRKRFTELQAAYNGTVKLRLAAENMLDNLFNERLETGDLLPFGNNGDCLLIETSTFNPPVDLPGTLERIKAKGYHPVLAHPERYVYMNKNDYRQLKSAGVKFQLNLPSLCGMYGSDVGQKAEWILKQGMYDCAGMDLHRKQLLGSVEKVGLNKKLQTTIVQQKL